jgi:two-component system NtrC family sensor kinase
MRLFKRRKSSPGAPALHGEAYYRDLKRRNVIRLFLTYVAPILLLGVYFYFQYQTLANRSQQAHLRAIADNRASTLDLYLAERLVNLVNLIDDPRLPIPPTSSDITLLLKKLQTNSATFVDLGYFDSSGVQAAYSGPFPSLEKRNYGSESWYVALREGGRESIITDVYMGFRERPHFTIAVSRVIAGLPVVLRATLDPQRIYDYINPVEDSLEVFTTIVNREGSYQLVSPRFGAPLQESGLRPPETPRLGVVRASFQGHDLTYAYSWLRETDWALVVAPVGFDEGSALSGFNLPFIVITLALVSILSLIIFNRAGSIVRAQMESDRTRAQLEHAAKLASVGELASGIAHEINNPLAVISGEAGLLKDFLDPQFNQSPTPAELTEHLDSIQEAVFRCRDITRKLLRFVRKSEVDLKAHDIHTVVDAVVDGLLGPEMLVSNVKVVRKYNREIPPVLSDANQLQQVILNIINNAVDAIGQKPGTITIATSHEGRQVRVGIADTGQGMTPRQLEQIFMPFFTTKEVGKGTGLGLSVSYGIMKSLGGGIEVESEPGKGSVFTLVLPVV